MKNIEPFIQKFTDWVNSEDKIKGAILVGSWARNAAKETSDVDMVMIVVNPEEYLKQNEWINSFGKVKKFSDEDWGLVKVRRVFYEDGFEVEFGITTSQWTNINPVDAGTKRVISDGCKILVDKTGSLTSLVSAIQ